MNERIKQIAEQARKYARDYVAECKHYGHYMEHNEYELRFEEKFAELIVKECADWIENEEDEQGDYIHDSFYWAPRLLKHFGVE